MEMQTTTRFCDICNAEVQVPADLLAGLAEAPRALARAFREPHTTTADGGWTPHEVAAHLADAAVVEGWRLRQILAEDEPELQPFDQDRWAAKLYYGSRELATSLATYSANRMSDLELLRSLDEAGWERAYTQPEYGRRTLRALVLHVADHDLAHLRQVKGES
jgi:hypothetical protein